MTTQTSSGFGYARPSLAALVAAAIVVGAVYHARANAHRPSDGDSLAIKSTIERSFALWIEGCTVSAHATMQEHKAALSPLWSDATRTTDELATRTTEFNAVWATVPPGAIAADIATSIAEATADPSLMPIQKLDAIIDYVAPTPNARRPWDTPRDEELKEVDRCQEEYALPGHGGMRTTAGVTAFDYHRIDITGDRANVDVTIDAWFSPFGLDAASDQRERWQKEFRYVLERRAVTWRIVSEWFDFQP